MGQRVQRWVADDGKEFDNQISMLQHELSIIDGKEIEIFLLKKNNRRKKEYKRLLTDWQKHVRSTQMPTRSILQKEHEILDDILDEPIEEWTPEGGFQLDEDDEEVAIQRSFQRATAL